MNAAVKLEEYQASPAAAPWCDFSVLAPTEFQLESGERLSRPELNLRVYGDRCNPIIIVAGGVSASRRVALSHDDAGWWDKIVAPDGAINLDTYCVIGFDFLPNSGEVARTISTKDQARLLQFALTSIGIETVFGFVGASYGAMIGLAYAELFPAAVENLVVISAAERPHPAATAIRGIQRRIIELADRVGEPAEGVALARQLAMTTYRTRAEFDARFGADVAGSAGQPYDVCDYLIARGKALQMSPERYVTLSDSIDRHRIDAARIDANCLVIAVEEDQLVPIDDSRRLANNLERSQFASFSSLFGHDAFLKEPAIISSLLTEFLVGASQ